ncbi:MAG: HAD hydrolase-like protein [Gammaproteobacteria bacterium]|nr:HAD hydrolase-like protein [Gammaproteobacteria bacterium]
MTTGPSVIFDLDGTLTDPALGITKCIQSALRQLDRPVPEAASLHWCIGPPLADSFGALLESDDEQLIGRAVRLYRKRFQAEGMYENELIDGVVEALSALHGRSFRLFVATSKPHVFATPIVEFFGLDKYFDAIYGAELDGTRSDKYELIDFLMAQEGLAPDGGVIMVGDREHDIIGAVKARILSIGVTFGYGAEGILRKHGATAIAHSPQQIPALVDSLLRGSQPSG